MSHGDAPPALRETRAAFDSVAADYDGPRGNNALIQDLRAEVWRWIDAVVAPHSRLLDLGCGTGLDAVRMAQKGHWITAADWSAGMVARTADRAERHGMSARVRTVIAGAHELERIDGDGIYHGVYSNLGPLNCVPNQRDVARESARLLQPGGVFVCSVIGRICPWEVAYYLVKGRWKRMVIRYARGVVPVSMNRHTIWTRYFTPRQFYRAYQPHFSLVHYRGLCLFAPPPYLSWVRSRHAHWYRRLWRIDRRVAGWPVLRAAGDHFLMVMRKR